MNDELISDEATAEATLTPHAFAAGQEVTIAGEGEVRAKVVAQAHDEEGLPVYEVVYSVRAKLPESALTAAE